MLWGFSPAGPASHGVTGFVAPASTLCGYILLYRACMMCTLRTRLFGRVVQSQATFSELPRTSPLCRPCHCLFVTSVSPTRLSLTYMCCRLLLRFLPLFGRSIPGGRLGLGLFSSQRTSPLSLASNAILLFLFAGAERCTGFSSQQRPHQDATRRRKRR